MCLCHLMSCSLPHSLQRYLGYVSGWWDFCDHQKTCPRLSNTFHFKSLFTIYNIDKHKANILSIKCLPFFVSICFVIYLFWRRWVCCFWDMVKMFWPTAKTSNCSEENHWCCRTGTKIWVRWYPLSQRFAFGAAAKGQSNGGSNSWALPVPCVFQAKTAASKQVFICNCGSNFWAS